MTKSAEQFQLQRQECRMPKEDRAPECASYRLNWENSDNLRKVYPTQADSVTIFHMEVLGDKLQSIWGHPTLLAEATKLAGLDSNYPSSEMLLLSALFVFNRLRYTEQLPPIAHKQPGKALEFLSYCLKNVNIDKNSSSLYVTAMQLVEMCRARKSEPTRAIGVHCDHKRDELRKRASNCC